MSGSTRHGRAIRAPRDAWELGHHGVPHTVIPDNQRLILMAHRMVDIRDCRHTNGWPPMAMSAQDRAPT